MSNFVIAAIRAVVGALVSGLVLSDATSLSLHSSFGISLCAVYLVFAGNELSRHLGSK